MAYGTLTVTRWGLPIRIGHGIKMVTGKVGWPATNSGVSTSGIEKYFRRCTKIDMTLNLKVSGSISAYIGPDWKRSSTHRAGVMKIFALSNAAAAAGKIQFGPATVIAATSGTFTAFGF